MSITNVARCSCSGPAFSMLSPVKSAKTSLDSSVTQRKTKRNIKKQRPSKIGDDRWIPTRNNVQMEMAAFLLTKEKEHTNNTNNSALLQQKHKAWSMLLNGCDIDKAKVLNIRGKSLDAPGGFQNNLEVCYSQDLIGAKKMRWISSSADRVLDAPRLHKDFEFNLFDWSSQNMLLIALHKTVYLWNATRGATRLLKLKHGEGYVSSLSSSKDGNCIAVGTSNRDIQLWDVEREKRLRTMTGHRARVTCLSWNNHVLSSGSKSGRIKHHDVRVADHHICTVAGHSQDVCGLQWSPNGQYLSSSSKDGVVKVWSRVQEGSISNVQKPVHSWSHHQGAVKAVAWCPWQTNILASGGGTNGCCIQFWNMYNGACVKSLDTQSQISSVMFAPNYRELVSAHGGSHNNVVIWKYPSLTKVAELSGHEKQILSMAMSPDKSTIATLAEDETIRLWKSFEMNRVKKVKIVMPTGRSINETIR
ncbi:cell division cycle protein 20 homolog [Antennarius striatus]|uniref:cell division cycle protein 20 homolog n=1 Tax=Antennarius striatus TaxID=241820 RepID=UPI0035B2E11A